SRCAGVRTAARPRCRRATAPSACPALRPTPPPPPPWRSTCRGRGQGQAPRSPPLPGGHRRAETAPSAPTTHAARPLSVAPRPSRHPVSPDSLELASRRRRTRSSVPSCRPPILFARPLEAFCTCHVPVSTRPFLLLIVLEKADKIGPHR